MKIPHDMKTGLNYPSNNFGRFEIIDYQSAKRVLIKFLNTGYTTITRSDKIRTGVVKDLMHPHVFGVGYLGDGDHMAWSNGKDTKCYSVWHSMITRCYSHKYQDGQQTYKGCTVSPLWHDFQNFADWFEKNYIEGYHLDKDIKVDGNKVYSPDKCMFVSRDENNEKAQAKTYLFVSPDLFPVTIHNMRKFCEENDLCFKCMSLVNVGKNKSHKGWTKCNTQN